MDDVVDWIEGFQSISRLKKVIQETRAVSLNEADERARRGSYFAGIAVDFIEATRVARPHIAFLPLYYAFLNLCKLMIACSDRSKEVDGGIPHGVSYNPSHKESRSLFTERLRMHAAGVLPLLYEILTQRRLPTPRQGRPMRGISVKEVWSRITDVEAEHSECEGSQSSRLLTLRYRGIADDPNTSTFSLKISVTSAPPLPTGPTYPYHIFPGWKRTNPNAHDWCLGPFPSSERDTLDIRSSYLPHLVYAPATDKRPPHSVMAAPLGRMLFPEEIPIFLALYHLSSVVRYKPRFLETLRDSDAWPLVLTGRRHLLYKGSLLALSYVLQKEFSIVRE